MAIQESNYRDAPKQLPDEVLAACVEFLKRKNVVVTDPTAPISIAQSMLVYMGVGAQHPVNGTQHAMRVIDTFYKSKVNKTPEPVMAPQITPMSRKKKLRKAKTERRREEKASGKKPVKRVWVRDAFYGSVEWKRVRYEALKRSSGRCECCGASPREGAILNVDHIKPLRRFPDLALKLSNLQVLCASCNFGKGSWDSTDWRNPQPEEKTELDREYEAIMGPIR